MSSSLRTQTYVEAEAPRVYIYDNYVMYDCYMPYKRFNRDNCHCDFENARDEIQYYRNNYRHFLVLKFSRNTNEVILYDHVRRYLYVLGNPFHTHEVDVVETWNDFYERGINKYMLCIYYIYYSCDENEEKYKFSQKPINSVLAYELRFENELQLKSYKKIMEIDERKIYEEYLAKIIDEYNKFI